MKSAYEIAMARLEAESGPSKKLTDGQKARIADIDSKYDAMIAEAKLGHDAKLVTADPAEREAFQAELSSAIVSLEEKRERDKQEIWNSSGE